MLSCFVVPVVYMFLYSVIFATASLLYIRRQLKRIAGGKRIIIQCPNCKGVGKVTLQVSQVWVDCTLCGTKGHIERFIP